MSVKTGSAPEANAIPVPKDIRGTRYGRGGLRRLLPQGRPERERRVLNMMETHDAEGLGNCTNEYECETVLSSD